MSDEDDPSMREGRTLRDFFGLDGGEFMKTGMTLQEWSVTRSLERIHNSYVQQERHEQKRRLNFVIRLAVEGTRIREIDRFGSAVLESAVENVMEGDWDRVLQDIDWCTFKMILAPSKEEDRAKWSPKQLEEMEQREREYAKLWEPFRTLLEQAYATRHEAHQDDERH